jgi:2Fe-2S ferredoxin
MPRVLVQPHGFAFEAQPGETVMAAARRNGYYWPTTCGGHAECTTCACLVISAAEALAPMGRAERFALQDARGRAVLNTPTRLACQALVIADCEVRKPGVLPPNEQS